MNLYTFTYKYIFRNIYTNIHVHIYTNIFTNIQSHLHIYLNIHTYFRLRSGVASLNPEVSFFPFPGQPKKGIPCRLSRRRPPLPSPVLVRGEAGRLRRGRAHGARPITPDRLTGAASRRRGGGVEGRVDCEWRTPLRSSANGCWEPGAGAKCRAGAKREAEANPGFAL